MNWIRVNARWMVLVAALAVPSLLPAAGSIWIEGGEDCVVRVNGEQVGTGALKVFRLPAGNYRVEVENAEGERTVQNLIVPSGRDVKFHVQAPAAPAAAPAGNAGKRDGLKSPTLRQTGPAVLPRDDEAEEMRAEWQAAPRVSLRELVNERIRFHSRNREASQAFRSPPWGPTSCSGFSDRTCGPGDAPAPRNG